MQNRQDTQDSTQVVCELLDTKIHVAAAVNHIRVKWWGLC